MLMRPFRSEKSSATLIQPKRQQQQSFRGSEIIAKQVDPVSQVRQGIPGDQCCNSLRIELFEVHNHTQAFRVNRSDNDRPGES
jgi:hypothetical protein